MKIKYWSSSPLVGGKREHLVLLTVEQPKAPAKTVKIASCQSGAISARIALALEAFEKDLK